MRTLALALIVTATIHGSTKAQGVGTVVGTVAVDSSGHRQPNAQVSIVELERAVVANHIGEFEFKSVPPGKYSLIVRSVGFLPHVDTIVVAEGRLLDQEVILTRSAVALDAVVARSTSEKAIAPRLQSFEQRRQSHKGGYFVTDSLLRSNEDKSLAQVLGRIPGLIAVPNLSAIYMASSRNVGDGGPIFQAKPDRRCYVSVYIDGANLFHPPASSTNPPVDFAKYPVNSLAGIEFYAGGGSVPSQFNETGSGCGVLLLWTRER